MNLSYHKRLSELERMGIAKVVKKRPCRVTGMVCLVWDVTSALPIPLAKPLPRPSKKTLRQGAKEMSVLHMNNPAKRNAYVAIMQWAYSNGR